MLIRTQAFILQFGMKGRCLFEPRCVFELSFYMDIYGTQSCCNASKVVLASVSKFATIKEEKDLKDDLAN